MKAAIATLSLFLYVFTASSAQADDQPFVPDEYLLSDSNSIVEFEVDTTWHRVHGTAKGLRGWIKPNPSNVPFDFLAEIRFPVSQLDTGWDSRDEVLQEHIDAVDYPSILVSITEVGGNCSPQNVPCSVELKGTIQIRDTIKPLVLQAQVTNDGEFFKVSGKTDLAWGDFGMRDPSIVVAKVNPQVQITYVVSLRKNSSTARP